MDRDDDDAHSLGVKYLICPAIPHRDRFTPRECATAIDHFNLWSMGLSTIGPRKGCWARCRGCWSRAG